MALLGIPGFRLRCNKRSLQFLTSHWELIWRLDIYPAPLQWLAGRLAEKRDPCGHVQWLVVNPSMFSSGVEMNAGMDTDRFGCLYQEL